MKKTVFTSLLLGLLCSSLNIQAQSNSDFDAYIEELRQSLDSKLTSLGIEGAALTLINSDEQIYTITGGYANGVNDPVDTTRLWHWASGTKPLTGFVILQMIEEELLDINDPVGKFLHTRSIPNLDSTITIKQLLQHTSGLREIWSNSVTPSLWSAVWSNRDSVWNPRDFLPYMPEPLSSKGTHLYSSTNSYLLSFIIEEISGKSLDTVFQERIFDPLNMKTSYLSSGKSIDMSTLNGVWNGSENRSEWSHSSYLSSRSGNSAHISSPMDAAKFYRAYYMDSLLSKAHMDSLRVPAAGSEQVIAENTACFSSITQLHGYETTMFRIVYTDQEDQEQVAHLYGHGGNGVHNSFSYHWAESDITIILGINDFAAEEPFSALIFDLLCGVQTTVSTETTSNLLPETINLSQNYPNPFNPSTRISFSLPEASDVRLTVYNLLGQEVATLIHDKKSAGTHSVTFDARNLSSGVYFYRLSTGDTQLIKRMMIMK